LTLGATSTAIDNTCAYLGKVMSQSPSAGATVNFGSAVNVTLGKKNPNPKASCD
jgi:beta-lactam-binding protein with PASTA domain